MSMDDNYNSNDNELLYLIRTGDPIAQQMLLDKYENYMMVLMDRFVDGNLSESREDLKQECRILLADLCMRYREDQGCRFLTFLVNGLKNHLKSKKRTEKRKMKDVKFVSLDSYVSEDESGISYGEYINPKNAFFQPEYEWRYADSIRQLKELIESLSEKEKQVWKLMNEDVTYEQAAEIMGISRKQFDNMRLRLKKRIVFCIMKTNKLNEH